jgi:VanZ family protein
MHTIIRKLKQFFGKFYFAFGWSLIILILLALPGSMLPHEQGFVIPGFDKIVHFCLFAGFVFFWCFYFESKNFSKAKLLRLFFLVFLVAQAYGIGMEYVQKYFIPQRDFELGDIIADLLGAGVAYGLCNLGLGQVP